MVSAEGNGYFIDDRNNPETRFILAARDPPLDADRFCHNEKAFSPLKHGDTQFGRESKHGVTGITRASGERMLELVMSKSCIITDHFQFQLSDQAHLLRSRPRVITNTHPSGTVKKICLTPIETLEGLRLNPRRVCLV